MLSAQLSLPRALAGLVAMLALLPASAHAQEPVDLEAPTSAAQPPQYASGPAIPIAYSAADSGGSGLARVDLYARAPGELFHSLVASESAPGTGSFSYAPTGGDGTYSFYTVATDQAGNSELPPLPAEDGSTTLDTAAPSTRDDVPADWRAGPVAVTLTRSDGGSGVIATHYTTDGSTPTTASPAYDPGAKPTLGNGEAIRYFSVDAAGNREAARTSAPARVDEQAPLTSDDVPLSGQAGPVAVTLAATDGSGSGVARTHYTTDGSEPTTTSAVYDAAAKPVLAAGQTIRYFSVDAVGNAEQPKTSAVLVATPATEPVPEPAAAPTTTTTTPVLDFVNATAVPAPTASRLVVAALLLPPGQRLRDVRRRGLRLKLYAGRPLQATLQLFLRPATARRLRLPRRVARRVVEIGSPGQQLVTLRLRRAARVRLRRVRRATLELRSTLTSTAGRSHAINLIRLR